MYFKFQADLDKEKKDLIEQRNQVFRMFETLREQGIEIGPSGTIYKQDHAGAKLPPSKTGQGEVMVYNEYNTPSSSPQSISSNSLSLAAPGHGGGGSGSSIRKSSSLTSSSVRGEFAPANSIVTGGSLKKESLANLHLMSARNEDKAKLVEEQKIQQQIPLKLSSLSKESKSKKSTTNLAAMSSSASSSKGITNLGK